MAPSGDENQDDKQTENPILYPIVELLEAKRFKCEHCPYSTQDKSRMTIHMRKHTGEKPFACSHCSFTCAHSATLRYHKFVHSERKYSCKICSFKSTILSSLKYHILAVHGEGKNFPCLQCSYKGNTKRNLQMHMRLHNPRFKCPHCDYRVGTNSGLQKHIRSHAKDMGLEEDFECSLCSYKSYTALNIISHMKVQHIELKCEECGEMCEGKNKLQEHKKKHIVKRFLCDQCGYAASRKDYLTRHIKLRHAIGASNVKECPNCCKRFLSKKDFNIHIKMHDVFCKICNRDLQSNRNLRTHNKVFHSAKKEEAADVPVQNVVDQDYYHVD